MTWTAPANGGSTINRYTITPYIGATPQTARFVTGTPPITNTTVTGLTNGTAYTFRVTASNGVGAGTPPSGSSGSVTPLGAPGTPTSVAGTPGNGSATVSWNAPVSNGGSVITGYAVTPYVGSTAQPVRSVTGNPPASSTVITGLTNGVTYTFRVAAINAIGTGATATSNSVTPAAPPGAPTGVQAISGNTTIALSWTAPANGGSVITRYTITPYIGTTAQTTRTVIGSPPASSTTITGLANGTTYTFTVTATNAAGTGVASAASPAVTPVPPPAFVQQGNARGAAATTVAAQPPSVVKAGNRLVVMVGAKNTSTTATQSVRDSAGNTYVRLTQVRAADQTEMTVWTAPINAGGGTRPTITATVNGTAALAIQVVEYSGLSTVNDATVVDKSKTATGVTGLFATTVQSGATAATTAANQLALGFYLDAGSNRGLTVGSGFTMRANNSPATNMQFYAEDQISAFGSAPNAGVGTGARTTWLMTTVVLKHP